MIEARSQPTLSSAEAGVEGGARCFAACPLHSPAPHAPHPVPPPSGSDTAVTTSPSTQRDTGTTTSSDWPDSTSNELDDATATVDAASLPSVDTAQS